MVNNVDHIRPDLGIPSAGWGLISKSLTALLGDHATLDLSRLLIEYTSAQLLASVSRIVCSRTLLLRSLLNLFVSLKGYTASGSNSPLPWRDNLIVRFNWHYPPTCVLLIENQTVHPECTLPPSPFTRLHLPFLLPSSRLCNWEILTYLHSYAKESSIFNHV